MISGVTITGGYATSSPESVPFVGQDGVIAFGGGVEIPPKRRLQRRRGRHDREQRDHRQPRRPDTDRAVGPHDLPGRLLPVRVGCRRRRSTAWGNLTLIDTMVSHNRAGAASGPASLASDAQAGGIQSWLGALTLVRTSVDDNVAVAAGPNGRFADGGGVFLDGGSFSMSGSSVSHNSASLAASLPDCRRHGRDRWRPPHRRRRRRHDPRQPVRRQRGQHDQQRGLRERLLGRPPRGRRHHGQRRRHQQQHGHRVRARVRRRRFGCRRDGRHVQRGGHERQHGDGDERQ